MNIRHTFTENVEKDEIKNKGECNILKKKRKKKILRYLIYYYSYGHNTRTHQLQIQKEILRLGLHHTISV